EVQFYCLDFGGGSLATLAGLPHVGGIASRSDVERVSRTVAEVQAVLGARGGGFAARGIGDQGAYRGVRRAAAGGGAPGGTARGGRGGGGRARGGAGGGGGAGAGGGGAPGPPPAAPWGAVFGGGGGGGSRGADFGAPAPPIRQLAARGLTYGVHLILTTNRW